MVDLKGAPGTRPRGPNSVIFMQFSAKKLQNNRLAHPFWELAHPPRENPESATGTDLITTLLDIAFASRKSPSSSFVFINIQHMFREYSHTKHKQTFVKNTTHMGIWEFFKHFKHNSNGTRKYHDGLELDVNSWVKRYRQDLIRKGWVKRYRKEDYDFTLSRRYGIVPKRSSCGFHVIIFFKRALDLLCCASHIFRQFTLIVISVALNPSFIFRY